MCVLEFHDVHRGYGKGDVLAGVNLQVRQGEVVGLLGRNGAGKTTLIRLVMGMLIPGQGTVKVFGEDPRRDPVATRKRIGYVAEDQELPPFLKARDVIAMYRSLYPKWDEAFATDLMRRFELPPDRRIKDLSRGQARQVALLCAVSHRPELLILDEPAGGLDPAARREFLETSIQLLNETGTTILFSSHYMADVERLAGRVVMIHEGQVLIDTDMDGLREEHSLVLVPRGPNVTRDALLDIEGCLGVRERTNAFHAVFKVAPARSRQLIEKQLGIEGVVCRDTALEEMFIELAGGQ